MDAVNLSAGDCPIEVLPEPIESSHGQNLFKTSYYPLGIIIIKLFNDARSTIKSGVNQLGFLNFSNFEPMLLVQSVWGGQIDLRESSSRNYNLCNGHHLFHHAMEANFSQAIYSREPFEMITLCFCLSMLEDLIGNLCSLSILEKLGVGNPDANRQLQLPTRLGASLHSAFSTSLSGTARALHSQAKALEYLSLLVNHLNPSAHPVRKGVVTRPIATVQDYLRQMEGAPPSLATLAKHFQVSVRQLQIDFKEASGMNIRTFLKNQRMERARCAILDSDIPLKALADHLGYRHVSNFNLAFRKYFGYPPGRLRRDFR
jgi:AraC-like DNA-binding protein